MIGTIAALQGSGRCFARCRSVKSQSQARSVPGQSRCDAYGRKRTSACRYLRRIRRKCLRPTFNSPNVQRCISSDINLSVRWYSRCSCGNGIFWMFDLLGVLGKVVLIIAGTAAVVTFIALSPVLFCHGGGEKCGLWLLGSLPLAGSLIPAILVFGTICFFPSTKKVLLAVLAIVYVAAAIPLVVGSVLGTAQRNYLKSHPTKGMQDYAVKTYGQCLDMAARSRAQFSDDQPSAIEHWSLDKCARERKALFDDYQIDPAIVAASEHEFQINLSPLIDAQRRRWPKRT